MGEATEWWNRAVDERRAADACRKQGLWVPCYQHAGQSLEFALKAIFLRRNGHERMPAEYKGARWHRIGEIAELCRIESDLGGLKCDKDMWANWLTAKTWNSNARFAGSKVSKDEVTELMVAAFNPAKGIFQWLEKIFQRS